MGSIKFSIKRPVTVFMCMCIVIILGFVSLTKMDRELMGSIDFPYATVITTYSGAGPEEVESLVTELIEGAVASVEGIDTISSTSSEGMSMVVIQFDYGTDMDEAITSMRDKIGMIKGALPEDAEDPTVMKLDMNSQAVATIAITSDSLKPEELKTLVEDDIQPRIERQSGVASANLSGGLTKEITVTIHPEKLEGLNLSMSQIAGIIASENRNLAGGSITYGDKSLTISSKLKMATIEDVKQIPITIGNGSVLQLQDIATIREEETKKASISRYNGEECITLAVSKASDGNTVAVVNAVQKEVSAIQKAYSNIKISVVNETGSIIEESIDNVLQNIFLGAVLAIIILFVFLKNVGLTGIIAISMPLSIVLTIVLLYFCDISLNVISLGGLSIGVGMLVDNSVVVIENIYRYRTTEGYGKIKGTFRATVEVLPSILASTLTSIVIFLPFLFTEGMVKEMFTDLALSVVFSLVASLISAVTIVPMIAGNFVNNVHRNKAPKLLGFINVLLNIFDWFIKKLSSGYARILRVAIRARKRTMAIIIAVFIGSLMLYSSIGMELMPASDEGQVNITVEFPANTRLEVMEEITNKIEARTNTLPELTNTTVSISTGSSLYSSSGSSISLELVDKTERNRSSEEIAEAIRTELKDIAGAKITVSASSTMGSLSGGGVTINIEGEEIDTLNEIAENIMFQLQNIEGTRQIKSSTDEASKQVAVTMKKDKIRQYGLTGSEVANQIKAAIEGTTATTLKANGSEMDIKLVYPETSFDTMTGLKDITIRTASGIYLPLSSLVDITMEDVQTEVVRQNQTRYVTVSADIFGRDLGSVSKDVQKVLDQMNFPDGYTVSIGGTNEMMEEAFSSLLMVIVLAIILVYAVMAAQFESFINPFIIMFTIPLALTGTFVLLFLMNESISMVSLLGCLVLVGIVVNNGIVLIDYINTLRFRDGMNIDEAVLKACPIRLRPILMTALTTILAQIPVIISNGSNSEMLRGMGIVIAGGLTTSTILTLVAVPILYMQFDKLNNGFRKLFRLKPKTNAYDIDKECC